MINKIDNNDYNSFGHDLRKPFNGVQKGKNGIDKRVYYILGGIYYWICGLTRKIIRKIYERRKN